MQQGVDERAVAVPGRRVHDHARRLVDHDQIADPRTAISRGSDWATGAGAVGAGTARATRSPPRTGSLARVTTAASSETRAVLDESLQLRSGMLRHERGQGLIQARPAQIGRDHDVDPGAFAQFHRHRPARLDLGVRSLLLAETTTSGAGRRDSHQSIPRLTGTSSSEMNCDVETWSKTNPRGSPR